MLTQSRYIYIYIYLRGRFFSLRERDIYISPRRARSGVTSPVGEVQSPPLSPSGCSKQGSKATRSTLSPLPPPPPSRTPLAEIWNFTRNRRRAKRPTTLRRGCYATTVQRRFPRRDRRIVYTRSREERGARIRWRKYDERTAAFRDPVYAKRRAALSPVERDRASLRSRSRRASSR